MVKIVAAFLPRCLALAKSAKLPFLLQDTSLTAISGTADLSVEDVARMYIDCFCFQVPILCVSLILSKALP